MSIPLFALGALLRIALWTFPRSIWCDEAASIACSSVSFTDTLRFYAGDVHPPLYFLSLHAAIKAFGLHEWAFRLPSFLAGIAALAGIYFFTKELFGRKTGLLALWLTAISPFALQMSCEIRNHGPALAFTAWAGYFLLKCMREPEKKLWGLAYAAFAWTAVGTAHFAWLLVPGALILMRRQWVFLTLALPFAVMLLSQSRHETLMAYAGHRDLLNVFWYFTNGLIIPVSFISKKEILFFASHSPVFLFFVSVSILALAALVSAIAADARRKSFTSLILAGFLIGPLLVIDLFDTDRFYARYFAFLFFLHAALLAHALAALRPKALKITSIALISAASLVSSAFILAYPADAYERSHFSLFADYLGSHGKKSDLVFCDFEMTKMHLALKKAVPQAKMADEERFDPALLDRYERIWMTQALLKTPGVREALFKKGFYPQGPRLFFEHSIILSIFSKSAAPRETLPPIADVPVPWQHGMEWFAPMGDEILHLKNAYDWDQ